MKPFIRIQQLFSKSQGLSKLHCCQKYACCVPDGNQLYQGGHCSQGAKLEEVAYLPDPWCPDWPNLPKVSWRHKTWITSGWSSRRKPLAENKLPSLKNDCQPFWCWDFADLSRPFKVTGIVEARAHEVAIKAARK